MDKISYRDFVLTTPKGNVQIRFFCSPEEIRKIYQCQISLRRFVTADEVANMAVFLASDMSGSISGQAIGVDGHTESLSNVMDWFL